MEQERNKKNVGLPLLLSLVMIGGMLAGLNLQKSGMAWSHLEGGNNGETIGPEFSLLQVAKYVENRYVDSLKDDEVVEKAIRNFLKELDPHSVYLSPKEYRQAQEQLNGYFTGIGINFFMIDDTATVGMVFEDGPAGKMGVKSGDKILAVNGENIAGVGLPSDSVVAVLRGEAGEKVRLKLLSAATGRTEDVEIVRSNIDLPSIPVAFMLDGKTGYVKINSFTRTTSREFAQAIKRLIEQEGLEDLVLDLRDNPGGFLEEAVEVLDHIFLDKHKLLVYTQGLHSAKKDYESNGASRLNIKKIAVLINEETASAAEIVTGALQDWDRAVVIGRRSFGKGLVQEEFPLANGGALRITVARYYTPSGRCIQRDYSDLDQYQNDLSGRFHSGELFEDHAHDGVSKDTTRYFTAGGRIVKGGGGISPEIYIPLDSIFLDENWTAFYTYAFEFAVRHPELLPRFSSEADYIRHYRVPDKTVRQFVDFVRQKANLSPDLDVSKYAPYIKKELKAGFIQLRFGMPAYYKAQVLSGDPFVEAALRQLKKKDPLALNGGTN